jgi:hypothetical protein
LTAKIAKDVAKFAKKTFPKVLVETPAPPALRKERIGKETTRRGWSRLLVFLSLKLLAASS